MIGFFLYEAPLLIPVEFSAWQDAEVLYQDITAQYIKAVASGEINLCEITDIETESRKARKNAEKLRILAEQAWCKRSAQMPRCLDSKEVAT